MAQAWERVIGALCNHHFKPDLEAARALYSAVAAHRLDGAPVWPMVVAPPGSMKTVLLEAMDGLQDFHFIDRLSPNTFLSGQLPDKKSKQTSSPSLLHRIGSSGFVVYADFSTILAMHRDHRNSILADMRRIYDGKLTREFGTTDRQEERSWEGRLTFAAACTPAIDSHFSIFQSLGERFVQIRPARPDGVQSAIRAMSQNRIVARVELREAVHELFTQMRDCEPTISGEDSEGLASLAEFTVRARTHVPRLGQNKLIAYTPEPEAPTRLAQQLAQLIKGSAMIDGRNDVNPEDLALARRVAFDCIPSVRRTIMSRLIAGHEFCSIALPASTRKYASDELEALGLLASAGKSKFLSDSCVELLAVAGMFG